MKRIILFVLLCTVPHLAGANDLAVQIQIIDREIAQLYESNEAEMKTLQKCEKDVKGFKIAGITLLSATAVGTVVNIVQAVKKRQLDNDINKLRQKYNQQVFNDKLLPKYDKYGKCIENCPFEEMTVGDELSFIDRNTEEALGDDSGFVASLAQMIYDSKNPDEPEETSETTETQAPMCKLYNTHTGFSARNPFTGYPFEQDKIITSCASECRCIEIKGVEKCRPHEGIDFGAKKSVPLFSTIAGNVAKIETNPKANDCGVYVMVESMDSNWAVLFCHMELGSIPEEITEGSYIAKGCQVGNVGSTGWSTGPHLHYGMFYKGKVINPAKFLPQEPYKCKNLTVDKTKCLEDFKNFRFHSPK